MKISDIRPEVFEMAQRVQSRIAPRFAEIDAVAEQNDVADARSQFDVFDKAYLTADEFKEKMSA